MYEIAVDGFYCKVCVLLASQDVIFSIEYDKEMQERREKLKEWITKQHHNQVRKDGEYYPNHLVRVAEMAENYVDYGYEIGLCHDLIEDTPWTTKQLWEYLESIGYTSDEAETICKSVHHLTEVYVSDYYPWLNRHQRKTKEAERLHAIQDKDTVTVKYCDLIDNLGAAMNLEPGFRKRYIAEKSYVIQGLTQGDPKLFSEVKKVLKQAEESCN
jgi:(p)ppGpp synthase/HD superfamily hydrolase